MLKKTLKDTNILRGTRVFVRADLNAPLDKKDSSVITDDTRVRSVIPTIKYLQECGARIILASHAGRPKGQVNEEMRLKPMGERLSELLGDTNVQILNDCVGDEVKNATDFMMPKDVVLLENLRFYAGEEKNDEDFAENLAKSTGAEVYVNDAFGAAHRAHASTAGITKYVDTCVAGFLMEKELQFLYGALDNNPKRPFTAVVGGAKVSTKITVLEKLIDKCDNIILGGGMIFTFYKAQGHTELGSSLVEDEFLDTAKTIFEKAEEKNVNIMLPKDIVLGDAFDADANSKTIPVGEPIPENWMGLDIGPESIENFSDCLANSQTVVWNGPMGVFEFDKFSKGTYAMANALAGVTDSGGVTVIGGGDSVAAVEQSGLASRMSHISTGGGASLELLEGKVLPGVDSLDDN
eukprot:g9989.t1